MPTFTLDLQVAAGADDCSFDGPSWAINVTRTYFNYGFSSTSSYKLGGGFRFTNVTIPKGSTITTAYLKSTCWTSISKSGQKCRIYGDKEPDAAAWTTLANYQSRRGTKVGGANDNYITTAYVSWSLPTSMTRLTEYQLPEIKTVIQEITDQDGWVSGNHLALWVDDAWDESTHSAGTPHQAFCYEDSNTGHAMKLHIEYVPPVWVNVKDVNGVLVTTISKLDGVLKTSIYKRNGIVA